jgi:hypothetical protein
LTTLKADHVTMTDNHRTSAALAEKLGKELIAEKEAHRLEKDARVRFQATIKWRNKTITDLKKNVADWTKKSMDRDATIETMTNHTFAELKLKEACLKNSMDLGMENMVLTKTKVENEATISILDGTIKANTVIMSTELKLKQECYQKSMDLQTKNMMLTKTKEDNEAKISILDRTIEANVLIMSNELKLKQDCLIESMDLGTKNMVLTKTKEENELEIKVMTKHTESELLLKNHCLFKSNGLTNDLATEKA